MRISEQRVRNERGRLLDRAPFYSNRLSELRSALGDHFNEELPQVSTAAFRDQVVTVFRDEDLAVNVTGWLAILRELNVSGDYPGFIIDERCGRALAATIADGDPEATLAESTFHFLDTTHHPDDSTAGMDDLEAGVTAGFQTRFSGWKWQAETTRFGVPIGSDR